MHNFTRTLSLFSMLAVCGAGALAHAEFEGTLEMKMTMPRGGGGNAKIHVSRLGTLSETSISVGGMQTETSVLFKTSNPDLAYALNPKNKTYTEVDLKAAREMAGKQNTDYDVKKVGSETVNGWKCEHLVVSDKNGSMDVWTSKDIGSMSEFEKVFQQQGGASEPLMKKLKALNADGFWVKMTRKGAEPDSQITMELLKAEKKKLAPGTFELPPGYTKATNQGFGAGGGPGGGQVPPEVMQKIQERMKSMTPEQREAMQKAMQQQMQQPHE